MFHWIGDEILSGEPEQFRISIVSFCSLIEKLKLRNTIRLENWENEKNFFALSIDDVPENFYINAFPVLKKAGIPFTIFANIELLNTEGYITTEQLKEISECELCTVGSHGLKHDYYCKLDKEAAKRDLEGSKLELERIIERKVDLYAFPYGSFYACGFKRKNLVANYYKYGFGTIDMPITQHSILPHYFLPRINVSDDYINKI